MSDTRDAVPGTPAAVAKLLQSETKQDLSAPARPNESDEASRKSQQSDAASESQTKPKRPGLPASTSAEDLKATMSDLQAVSLQYLRLLPWFPPNHPVRRKLKAFFSPPVNVLARFVAKSLHSRGVLASNLVYDLAVLFWKWVVNLFFREIKPRGAYKIPREGACIFVGAPHHNQFIDPLMLLSEARLQAGRRISFITAEASMTRRKFVGAAARTMHSIPVVRAQDLAKGGKGLVYMKAGDENHLYGVDTNFTAQLHIRDSVRLPKSLDFAMTEVAEVVSNECVTLKTPFTGDAAEALLAAGERLEDESKASAFEAKPKTGIESKGIEYKCLPYVDQTRMYAYVYKKLQEGGCIGIFPEGGSHDRTDLLPLKAGVAIMALGALAATPGLKVAIVPVGLSYFHAHRFRSRAVVEFGSPLYIPPETVDQFNRGGQDKRDAIGSVLNLVFDGLKSVSVLAPDYETLMLIQATRRLYRPPGQQLSLGQVVELNRRFIIGYERYKDEPRVIALKAKVQKYNKLLEAMGLRDHQVDSASRAPWHSLLLLVYRSLLVTAWGLVALPGVILNAPMFIAATTISRKKAKQALAASTVKIQARDVVATWKILVSLGLSPIVYAIYGTIAVLLSFKYDLPLRYKLWIPIFLTIAIPSIGYSALKFGEVGMDIYKSLRPLTISLLPGSQKYIDRLQQMRAELSQELSDLVEEFGPKVFEDFKSNRVVASSAPRERKSSGSRDGLLNAPLEWLDDTLFGWSKSSKGSTLGSSGEGSAMKRSRTSSRASSSSYVSQLEDVDDADYDKVLGMERDMSTQTHEGRSRRKSYNDLKAAKETEAVDASTTAREAVSDADIRHR